MVSHETSPQSGEPILPPISPAERQHNVNDSRRLSTDYGFEEKSGLDLYRASEILEFADGISAKQQHAARIIKEIIESLENPEPDPEQLKARLSFLLDILSD